MLRGTLTSLLTWRVYAQREVQLPLPHTHHQKDLYKLNNTYSKSSRPLGTPQHWLPATSFETHLRNLRPYGKKHLE
jgi:hypothetical protein